MEILFHTFWRLYHGKFSGLFCYCLYLIVIFGVYFIAALIASKNRPTQIFGIPRHQSLILLFLPIMLYIWGLYPGVYVYDSLVQLKEAASGIFSDWHPPLMSWLWSVLLQSTAMAESFFFAQVFLLIGAISVWGIILVSFSKSHWPYYVIVFLSPIWLLFSGVIVKDAVMAYSLLLGFGIVILAKFKLENKWLCYLFAFALVFISINIRQNALPAAFPLIYIIVNEIPAFKKRIISSVFLSMLIAFTFFIAGKKISYEYIKPNKSYIQQALFLHDLAFIKKSGGLKTQIPEVFKSINYSDKNISESWKPQSSVYLFFEYDNPSHPLCIVGEDSSTNILFKTWLISIWNNPLKYIQHRFLVFNSLLWSNGFYQSKNEKLWLDFNLSHLHPKYSLPGSSQIDHVLFRSTHFLAEFTPFFYPVFWLLALIVIFFMSFIRITLDEVYCMPLALSTSGLLYFAAYFLIAPHCEFRYVYWSVIACIFSFVLLFWNAQAIRRKSPTNLPPQSTVP